MPTSLPDEPGGRSPTASLLICAAISRPLERDLVAAGIEVIPEVCGPLDDVVHAYLVGRLGDRRFAMPGCSERRRQAQVQSRRTRQSGNGAEASRLRPSTSER